MMSSSVMGMQDDTVWIPAVPLPMRGWRTDRCECGKKFRGRDRRASYELHWRVVHEGECERTTLAGIRRSEARRIYDGVAAARGIEQTPPEEAEPRG